MSANKQSDIALKSSSAREEYIVKVQPNPANGSLLIKVATKLQPSTRHISTLSDGTKKANRQEKSNDFQITWHSKRDRQRSNKHLDEQEKSRDKRFFFRSIPAIYPLNVGLLFGGECATFGTCLALICTKNRLKSLEDAKSEASKISEIQPFSHFTKSCRKARDFFNSRTGHHLAIPQMA